MSDDEITTHDEPINATHALLLGVFTTFMAVAFLLLLIGDQVTASTF